MRKKKKDLIMPNNIETAFQIRMSAVISSTPSRHDVETILPKLKRLENKMRKRKTKEELGRLLNE